MRVGVPTEIKNNEYRVAITPAGVAELVHRGHEVLVQSGAGEGSAIHDPDFTAAGARLVDTADEVWAEADLLLEVKEPVEAEYSRMRKGEVLFTYLHLAASRPCTEALLASGTTSIATVAWGSPQIVGSASTQPKIFQTVAGPTGGAPGFARSSNRAAPGPSGMCVTSIPVLPSWVIVGCAL